MFIKTKQKKEEWHVCMCRRGERRAGWQPLSIGGSMPLYGGASCLRLAQPLHTPALAAMFMTSIPFRLGFFSSSSPRPADI